MTKKWILLAEDDPNDAALALKALGKSLSPGSVTVVADGAEALDLLYQRGNYKECGQGFPAVVLLDVKMPRMDGIEALTRIKGDLKLKTIPVVMFTSSRQDSDLNRCYLIGANAYVVKPVNFAEYRQTLELIAAFWGGVNELAPKAEVFLED